MDLEERRAAVVVAHAPGDFDAGVGKALEFGGRCEIVFLAAVEPGDVAEEDGMGGQGGHGQDGVDDARELAALVFVSAVQAVDMDVAQQDRKIRVELRFRVRKESGDGCGGCKAGQKCTSRKLHGVNLFESNGPPNTR